MVSRFEKITEAMTKEYKNTSLLAFVKLDDDQNTWTVLFSSPQINDTEEGKELRRKVFMDFSNILKQTYNDDAKTTIGRVGIFPLDVHIIEDALKFKAGTHITEPTKMNGNIVSEGYITVSRSTNDL